MAQEFLVLKCFSCETFQVIQVKKTNKWVCKICNEKQSITKVYGRGSPSDCRIHVQKLNLARGEKDAAERMYPADEYATTLQDTLGLDTDDSRAETLFGLDVEGSCAKLPALVTSQNSRWTMYCDQASEPDEDVDCDGPFATERAVYDVCKEVPSKKRKKKEEERLGLQDQSFDLIGENLTAVVTEGTYRKLEGTGSPAGVNSPDPQSQSNRPYHQEEISKIKMDISQFNADNVRTTHQPNASSRWSKYVHGQQGDADNSTQH